MGSIADFVKGQGRDISEEEIAKKLLKGLRTPDPEVDDFIPSEQDIAEAATPEDRNMMIQLRNEQLQKEANMAKAREILARAHQNYMASREKTEISDKNADAKNVSGGKTDGISTDDWDER